MNVPYRKQHKIFVLENVNLLSSLLYNAFDTLAKIADGEVRAPDHWSRKPEATAQPTVPQPLTAYKTSFEYLLP